ncbi:hypothetical protein HN014_07855 [Aquimarina sp. TRL1]|uniref:carboxypeptidase-like regulatory domain-containing protein n=1 Tax=Aquimarina sp. (strain TRL1) TaxID=2736252 RepID=UPI00158C09EA|nr:carboxypeptidase-like regulatory domain-containing protein [Aquimarina sp. TRL1]QKX04832.1 hypothetical protein HN014_07855 [Aquimarina sp. TRL1]
MRISLLSIAIFMYTIQVSSQTIRSKIIDGKTKLPIPFATITTKDQKEGTISNDDGTFTLSLPANYGMNASIHIASLGYITSKRKIKEIPGVISLFPETIALESVFISDKKLTADEIISKTKNKLSSNYSKNQTTTSLIHIKTAEKTTINNLRIRLKQSSISEIDQNYIDSLISSYPKTLKYYNTATGTYLSSLYKSKLVLNTGTETYNKEAHKKAARIFRDFSETLKRSMLSNSKLKTKSGLISTTQHIDSIIRQNDYSFHEKCKYAIRRSFSYDLVREGYYLDILSKSRRYVFQRLQDTTIHTIPLYQIQFSPGRKGKFKGTLFINPSDYAIVKFNFENTKPLFKTNFLGYMDQENIYKGFTQFHKTADGVYHLQHGSLIFGKITGINKNLHLIEKNKKAIQKGQKIKLNVHSLISSLSSFEITISDKEPIQETFFNLTAENRDFTARFIATKDSVH